MNHQIAKLIAIVIIFVSGQHADASPPKIVATIPPIQSLAAMVTQDIAIPDVLQIASGNLHNVSLRPSSIRKIANADLVIWLGPDLSPNLQSAINTNKPENILSLQNNANWMAHLRQTAIFTNNDDDDDHDDDHNDHQDGHAHGSYDSHAWLDPQIAQIWLKAIARRLAQIDPPNATRYHENAMRAHTRLDALHARISTQLAQLENREYIALHDSFQYFDKKFATVARGAFILADGMQPGPRTIAKLHEFTRDHQIRCLIVNSAQPAHFKKAFQQNNNFHIATIDILGNDMLSDRDIDLSDLYSTLLTRVADNFSACLQ